MYFCSYKIKKNEQAKLLEMYSTSCVNSGNGSFITSIEKVKKWV
jgi:hypothetical protein